MVQQELESFLKYWDELKQAFCTGVIFPELWICPCSSWDLGRGWVGRSCSGEEKHQGRSTEADCWPCGGIVRATVDLLIMGHSWDCCEPCQVLACASPTCRQELCCQPDVAFCRSCWSSQELLKGHRKRLEDSFRPDPGHYRSCRLWLYSDWRSGKGGRVDFNFKAKSCYSVSSTIK